MMKKTWTLLFSCLAFTASAEGEAQLPTYYAGDTVTVTYHIPGAFGDITAGSIEFFHDESAFELVGAKWELDNLFIKDVNLEKKQGVFAFKNPKSILNEVFTVTYLVREDAVGGEYEFTATLQLQDNQSPPYTIPVDLSYVVAITERAADDEFTTALFVEKAGAVGDTLSEDTYHAINEALTVYNALTEEEKAEVTDAYRQLCKVINSYNDEASAQNDVARSVTGMAFGIIRDAFSFLAELVTLITRSIFKK